MYIMMKDSTREYIVMIFRLYAALEYPDKKQIIKITDKLSKSHCNIAVKLDLLAVLNTIEHLRSSGKDDILKAVEYVYFYKPKRAIKRNELNNRVIAFATENYISERTVWHWLKAARETCAYYRGLNTATIEQLTEL